MNINITIYEGNNTLNVSDYTPTVTLTVVENLYQSGGGGAVNSVNGKTGTVVLGANDINESSTRFWLTDVLKSAYDGAVSAIANIYTKTETDTLLNNKVDKVSGKGLSQNDFTNDLKASYDGAVSGLANKVDKVTGYGLSKNDLTDLLKSTYDGYASQISAKANKSDTICLIAKIQTTYTITGTTSETPFTSLMIPANTFSSGDRVILDAMFLKTGGAGTTVSSFRISTSSSVSPITNATLMAKTPASIGATTIYPLIRNYIKIDSPTSTIMPPASSGTYNDFSSFSSLPITNLNIDWTVDQYIYPTETLGNSADAVTLKYFAIYKG